jgi:hypothetical protein
MKDRKPNKYIIIGLLLCAAVPSIDRFIYLPEFVHGVGMGLGITLELIGLYSLNHELKLRTWKKNLFRRFIHSSKTNS